MAHQQQMDFCLAIKKLYPSHFKDAKVIDAGSLDINGTNRYLFEGGLYIGIDVISGANVDIVTPIHRLIAVDKMDTVISTEMLEHDLHWKESLLAMYDLLRNEGLLVVTCATTGRKEHGTHENKPHDSPGTLDYYRNVTMEMFKGILSADIFSEYKLQTKGTDLQFYGIKK